MKKELIHEKLIENLIVFCVVYEVKLVILQKQFWGMKTRLKKLYFVLKIIKKKNDWKVNWKLDRLLRRRWNKVSHITKTILVDETIKIGENWECVAVSFWDKLAMVKDLSIEGAVVPGLLLCFFPLLKGL